jgi:hypothetical protein
MAAHILFGVLRLGVDLGFQAVQSAVDDGQSRTKVFTELINTLAHDESPVWRFLQPRN